ncbi:class F sortase [Modestobacter lapidis]|nr:class F sortase [Modestobacter lapidis]
MRIRGAYPPPLLPSAPPRPPGVPSPDSPRITRYDRTRHPSQRRTRHRAPRPVAARLWAGTSVVLAAAGVAAVVVLPAGPPRPSRLDVPVVVVAAPATVPAATPVAAAATAPALVLPLPASEPVRVQLPALGVTSDVMPLGLARDGSMEVPPGAYPVGWYDRSPTPGQLGPAVLAGHVDWDGKPGAFYGLRELLPGDEVVVHRADGTLAIFRVDRVEEHDKDEFPGDAVYGDIDTAGLRLITCGGSFDEDTGDYRENVIVFATLVATA